MNIRSKFNVMLSPTGRIGGVVAFLASDDPAGVDRATIYMSISARGSESNSRGGRGPALAGHKEDDRLKTTPNQNKAFMLEALTHSLTSAIMRRRRVCWSDTYIQHSAHIPPGRDGLFNLVRGLPDTLRYENHVILAEGDYVIAHGRFWARSSQSWIAADVVRFKGGKLAEHWDVLQDEASPGRIV